MPCRDVKSEPAEVFAKSAPKGEETSRGEEKMVRGPGHTRGELRQQGKQEGDEAAREARGMQCVSVISVLEGKESCINDLVPRHMLRLDEYVFPRGINGVATVKGRNMVLRKASHTSLAR